MLRVWGSVSRRIVESFALLFWRHICQSLFCAKCEYVYACDLVTIFSQLGDTQKNLYIETYFPLFVKRKQSNDLYFTMKLQKIMNVSTYLGLFITGDKWREYRGKCKWSNLVQGWSEE